VFMQDRKPRVFQLRAESEEAMLKWAALLECTRAISRSLTTRFRSDSTSGEPEM